MTTRSAGSSVPSSMTTDFASTRWGLRPRALPSHVDRLALHIDALDPAAYEIDSMLGIEAVRTNRNPLLGRIPREVVFRKIRSIVGRTAVVVDHRDLTIEAAAPEHFAR